MLETISTFFSQPLSMPVWQLLLIAVVWFGVGWVWGNTNGMRFVRDLHMAADRGRDE